MAETPSDLFGDLHIQLRRDMTGGNLIVDRDCTIKGNLTVEGEGGGGGGGETDWSKMPTATTEKVGGIVVGNGFTVVVKGGVTPGKVVGQLDVDFAVPTVLPSQAAPGRYDETDDAHAATPKAAYSIAYWTAIQLINTKIKTVIDTEEPLGNEDIPNTGAVVDYVEEALEGSFEELGTAAGYDVGNAAGTIPVLDGAGKLSISMMPERVIGGEYLGEVADQAAMIAKSNATVGDFVKRTDTGTYWMLGINSDGAYATAANWFEYAGAVASVNGTTGQVTQAQLGLETTLTTTSDVKFPSSKAVATYVESQLDDFTVDVDEVSIDYDGNGKLEVKDTFVIQVFDNIGGLKETSARETYLKQAATGITAWNNGTSYAIGDKVLNRGEIYRATAANQSKEPYAYSQGVTAVWEKYTIQGMIEDAGGGYEIDNITIVLNENDEMEVDEANLAADLTTNHGVASKDFVTAADKGKLNTTALMNAPAFVATNTYAVDDVVSHNGNLYKCILSYTSSYGPDAAPDGANGSTYWAQVRYSDLSGGSASLLPGFEWSSTKQYYAGEIVTYSGKIWLCKEWVGPGVVPDGSNKWEETSVFAVIFGGGLSCFDSTKTYNVGDVFHYRGNLYRVSVAGTISNPTATDNAQRINLPIGSIVGGNGEQVYENLQYVYYTFGEPTYFSKYTEAKQINFTTGTGRNQWTKIEKATLYAYLPEALSSPLTFQGSSYIKWDGGSAPTIQSAGLHEIRMVRMQNLGFSGGAWTLGYYKKWF